MSGAGEANFLYPQDPLHVEGIYNYYTEDPVLWFERGTEQNGT